MEVVYLEGRQCGPFGHATRELDDAEHPGRALSPPMVSDDESPNRSRILDWSDRQRVQTTEFVEDAKERVCLRRI